MSMVSLRRGAPAVALALLVGSCGAGSGRVAGRSVTTATGSPASAATSSPARTDGGINQAVGGRRPNQAGSPGLNRSDPMTAPGAAAPTSALTPPRTSPPGPDPIVAAARGGDGSLARVLLQPRPATRLVVEALVEPGLAPDGHALDHLARVLRSVSGGKPVTVVEDPLPAGGPTRWSAEELVRAADGHSRQPQGGDQAVLHLLYVHGSFGGRQDVFGVAVRGDVSALFVDQIRANASPVAPASVLEDAVTMHETGHLLGLVDLVLHTGRADPAHPGHSRNQGSVMYWAVDTSLVGTLLDGPPPVDFDAQDLADLATIRGGG